MHIVGYRGSNHDCFVYSILYHKYIYTNSAPTESRVYIVVSIVSSLASFVNIFFKHF